MSPSPRPAAGVAGGRSPAPGSRSPPGTPGSCPPRTCRSPAQRASAAQSETRSGTAVWSSSGCSALAPIHNGPNDARPGHVTRSYVFFFFFFFLNFFFYLSTSFYYLFTLYSSFFICVLLLLLFFYIFPYFCSFCFCSSASSTFF